jgi:hypothetical protein
MPLVGAWIHVYFVQLRGPQRGTRQLNDRHAGDRDFSKSAHLTRASVGSPLIHPSEARNLSASIIVCV